MASFDDARAPGGGPPRGGCCVGVEASGGTTPRRLGVGVGRSVRYGLGRGRAGDVGAAAVRGFEVLDDRNLILEGPAGGRWRVELSEPCWALPQAHSITLRPQVSERIDRRTRIEVDGQACRVARIERAETDTRRAVEGRASSP